MAHGLATYWSGISNNWLVGMDDAEYEYPENLFEEATVIVEVCLDAGWINDIPGNWL